MDLLLALALVAGIVFAALVFMLIVVVLGGDDVKPFKQSEEIKFLCPYCAGSFIPDPDHATPQSPKRGLLECPTCDRTFKRYRTQNGLEVLEEVFGTPLPIDPRDEK